MIHFFRYASPYIYAMGICAALMIFSILSRIRHEDGIRYLKTMRFHITWQFLWLGILEAVTRFLELLAAFISYQ